MKKLIIETCSGSVADCMVSYEGGADRIELNNGVHMGGLTPSYGTVKLAKAKMPLPIISMLRPRGGGFHYNSTEVETMFSDAEALIEAGTDGLVFGFLNEDGTIEKSLTQKMVKLCHDHEIESVFHRAFDVTPNAEEAIQVLINCGVDRVLTSGLKDKAFDGIILLKHLIRTYGDQIEFVLGSGINENNIADLIDQTGATQVHASFKSWYEDPTTESADVSYRYSEQGDYDGVSLEVLQSFVSKVR